MNQKAATKTPRRRAAAGVQVVRVSLASRQMLSRCYMPHIRGGGLFVPTETKLALGERVCLAVSLMNAPVVPVMGAVVWITPAGAVGHRPRGVGVQFLPDAQAAILQEHLKQLLTGSQEPVRRYTF